MDNFWNERYARERLIWGTDPSGITILFEEYLRRNNANDILIMGVGYGRNGKYFTEKGYNVDGIEISEEAVKIGKVFDPKINFIKGSILDFDAGSGKKYDAVFCHDILQLFPKDARKTIIRNCAGNCKDNGLILISCISDKDMLYGKGKKLEENTFEIKEGRVMYFSGEEQMKNIGKGMELIKLDSFIEEGRGRIYGIYRACSKTD
jgi:2-polyprenyl-3-methyl-5-hydroxy-6-metoxy-1,4-benzoquinol methylase